MKTSPVALALAIVLPCAVLVQNVQAQNVQFEFGTTLNAVLSDTVDARKSKPGDTVKARTSEDVRAGGLVVIPRGAKLVGRVTEAQPSARTGEPARLGIVFDRADLKDGRQVALHATLYALAAPEGAAGGGNSFGGGFGGGLGGGSASVSSMVDSSGRTAADDTSALGSSAARHEELKSSPGAIGGLNDNGSLYASSRGVFGLELISLEPPNTSPSAGSTVVLAQARNVRLSSGTRMLLSVESPGNP